MTSTARKPLSKEDILREIEEFNSSRTSTKSTAFLIYGKPRTGKSHLLTTARRPILIHSFDLGGVSIPPIQKGVEEGWIIVEHFEEEDPTNPSEYKRWIDRFERELYSKFFDNFGTFCIDSITSWVNCALYARAKVSGREAAAPYQQDYLIAANRIMRGVMLSAGSTPCDIILTAHVDKTQDEVTGRVETNISVFKTLRKNIPAVIGEIYYMSAKSVSGGMERRLLTRTKGDYYAGSRIGGDNLLDEYEEPNIKDILKKLDRNAEDMPKL